MKRGETPAYAYVPPGLVNYRNGPRLDFKAMPMPARVAEARKLMQQAGFGPSKRFGRPQSSPTRLVSKSAQASDPIKYRRSFASGAV